MEHKTPTKDNHAIIQIIHFVTARRGDDDLAESFGRFWPYLLYKQLSTLT